MHVREFVIATPRSWRNQETRNESEVPVRGVRRTQGEAVVTGGDAGVGPATDIVVDRADRVLQRH